MRGSRVDTCANRAKPLPFLFGASLALRVHYIEKCNKKKTQLFFDNLPTSRLRLKIVNEQRRRGMFCVSNLAFWFCNKGAR